MRLVSAVASVSKGAGRVLLLLFLLAIPGVALSIWVLPEAAGPFVIGTLPAITAVTHVGSRLASQLAFATALIGGLAVLVDGSPWLAGVFIGATAAMAARYSRRGLESPVLMVPVVAAYLVTEPAKFQVGETLSPGSIQMASTIALILLLGGLWAALLGWLLLRHLPRPERERTPNAFAVPYAWSVGIASGLATFIAAQWAPGATAAWIVLTVILVIRPTREEMWTKTRDRVLGTLSGGLLAVVVLLVFEALHAPYAIAVTLGLVMLSVAMALQPKIPYGKYVFLLTPGIVLLEGAPGDGFATDLARVGFTVLGAVIAVLVALGVRQIAELVTHKRSG